MMMSVFRQGAETRSLDHLACIEIAVDAEASQMIMHAFMHNRAALVGLEYGEAIVKPAEPGDDLLNFAALYDTATSIREYRKMVDLKVMSPKDFPPSLFEADLRLVEIDIVPHALVRFPAKDNQAVRGALVALLNNPTFREHLVRRFVMQLMDSDDVQIVTRGGHKVDEVAPPGLAWEFQDDV